MNQPDTNAPSMALEPWRPPTPPSKQRSAFTRAVIALRPAVLPIVVGAISWVVSVHGGAHSVGDTIAPLLIAGVCTAIGTAQTVAAVKKPAHQRPSTVGESEPRTALVAARAGLVAWAVAGLSTLAAADMYTTNPYLRVLYTVIGATAPLVYCKLTTEHHDEMHLAYTQKAALEDAAHRATAHIEQTRQNGATTRTVTEQEHETIRTRVKEDGKTTRTQLREEGETVRAVLGTYAQLATPQQAAASRPGATPVRGSSAPRLSDRLRELLELSPSAAAALGADTATLLGHVAAADPVAQPADQDGNYL